MLDPFDGDKFCPWNCRHVAAGPALVIPKIKLMGGVNNSEECEIYFCMTLKKEVLVNLSSVT
jgi:hypothetical protein